MNKDKVILPYLNIFGNMSTSSNLAKQYQRKTDKQHILDNPDTYIGSVENVDSQMWIFDNESGRIVQKTIEYIPGLTNCLTKALSIAAIMLCG